MKTANIKAQNTKAKGRFLTITIGNAKGEETFMGKIKKMTSNYITFSRFSGKRGEVKCHVNSVKSIK